MKRKLRPLTTSLEIGCGTGFVLPGVRRYFPKAALHGTEFLEEGLAYARQLVPSANLKQLDALSMEDNSKYEAIGAFDVIEHIENDVLVLNNLSKALRKGGKVSNFSSST